MGRTPAMVALSLGVLLATLGAGAHPTGWRLEPLATAPAQPATVTVPQPARPVVAGRAGSTNTHGWNEPTVAVGGASLADLDSDLRAAYELAVAVSPETCHLSVSVLAAIGQVESGNLVGHDINSAHRVVPTMLGPVLDGTKYRAIPDTDGGNWDGNKTWDRALGPMQFIPASWRVAAVDLDEDGIRDPQDVFDAAGAAMVYLCAEGRDLGTPTGLENALLAYNHSSAYVDQVLTWKARFDESYPTSTADAAMLDLWALPLTAPVERGARQPGPLPSPGRVQAGAASAPGDVQRPVTPTSTPAPAVLGTPPKPPSPGSVPGSSPGSSPSSSPSADPSGSTPPEPPAPEGTLAPGPIPAPAPTPDPPPPPPEPTPSAPPVVDPQPSPTSDPTCIPTEPTPLPDPTQVADPLATLGVALPPCPELSAAPQQTDLPGLTP